MADWTFQKFFAENYLVRTQSSFQGLPWNPRVDLGNRLNHLIMNYLYKKVVHMKKRILI